MEPRTDGVGRHRIGLRPAFEGVGLAALLAADGIIAYRLGAPSWLAYLYLGIGVVLGGVRVWVAVATAPQLTPAAEIGDAGPRAIGYACVFDHANRDLAAQRKAIKACCAQRGLGLLSTVHDVDRDGGSRARPSLVWALEQIAEREADVLVVPRLRDLSPNVANLTPLLSWFNEERRRLIAIDLDLDTATEAGRLAASAVAGVGGWEHERISERTRRGLEAARSRGAGQGRTAVADVPELADRIQAMREQGMTLQAIADRLNEEGVPTLRGGAMWRPSSVQRATGYRRPSASSRGIELPRRGPSET